MFLSLSEKHCFSPSYCGSIVHISINYFIFKIPAVKINCYIDCRSKMNSLIFVSKLILRDVCMFKFFFPTWEFFSMTSPLPVKIHVWHLGPLSSEGSLGCQTYCDTRHPFIMVMSEDLCHSHPLPSFAERLAVRLSLPVFTTNVCCGWDSNT